MNLLSDEEQFVECELFKDFVPLTDCDPAMNEVNKKLIIKMFNEIIEMARKNA